MRFGATLSLLFAAASVAPAVLAAPFGAASSDDLEVRAFNDEVADLVARSGFDGASEILARAVAEMLVARTNEDPPNYKKDDPINGKKPKYTVKDPAPIPKYRQKDHNPPGGHASQRPKPKGGQKRGLEAVDGLWEREFDDELWARANDDPPSYKKNDPNNGKKPKYTPKDPAPIPKYRQKDQNPSGGHPEQRPKPKGGQKRGLEAIDGLWEREFDDELWARAELEDMWAREVEDIMARANDDPPAYKKDDPNNGKKPKYTPKDPAPIPKYRQKDHNPPGGHAAQRPKGGSSGGSSHKREFADYFW